jgi:hypothetical protein
MDWGDASAGMILTRHGLLVGVARGAGSYSLLTALISRL